VRTIEMSMKSVVRSAAHLLDDFAEQHEIEIRIDIFRGGLSLGLLAMNLLVDVFLGAAAGHEVDLAATFDLGDLLVERTPSGEARTMSEQMAEGDAGFAVDAEVVEEARDAIVELHLPVAHQHHHGDRRRERLGQRREIEDRFEPHRMAIWNDRAEPECALEGDVVAGAHHDRRARDGALFHGFGEGGFDFRPIHVRRAP
jgi:hypothetical protein